MYSISEVSKLTGITTYTLRYYEKIGLLPSPERQGGKYDGIRRYNDQDLRMIRFIYGLKQTGMKLEDIAYFTEDGCLLSSNNEVIEDIQPILHKRMEILDLHMAQLEQQIANLEAVKAIAQEKRAIYSSMLG
ncbi:MerR family transcriptional regulator [Paenibacillus sp. KN14-4R]|uniref:MerR family transcriptional regulator n=1 Tax=Paenibacillus sp. KN14-4R TaxID=3445773 RepID=UPI003F9F7851